MRAGTAMGLALACASAFADVPDFTADRLVSDGKGYVDTHYAYKRAPGTESKTKRVVLDYYDTDRCGYNNPYTSKTSRRTYFSFWKNDGTAISHCNYLGANPQVVSKEWKGAVSGSVGSGDLSVVFDYSTGTGTWGGAQLSGLEAGDVDVSDTLSYYLFAWNYDGVASGFGVYTLKEFRVYESADGGETETLVRDFVPCYANGRVGVYDRKTGAICLATSSGFSLSGYDIAVAPGKSLLVTETCAAPRTLSLSAGAELAFDGCCTLKPQSTAVLPESGVVRISMSGQNGRGTYELIDNLPEDFDLSAFAVGSVPLGHQGSLAKSGSKLVLTLAATAVPLPEALGETLTSDGRRYIDTGYAYRGVTSPQTKRITVSLHDDYYGKGAEGKATAGDRSVFGFWPGSGTPLTSCEWRDAYMLIWGDGWKSKQSSGAAPLGDSVLSADYFSNTVTWGTKLAWTAFPRPAGDAGVNVALFSRNTNGAGGNLSIYDFKELQIYETSDGGETETLARDFVPCYNDGSVGVYDRITSCFRYPSSADNDFVCSGLRWRLGVNGEKIFAPAGTACSYVLPDSAEGWVLTRDSDGSVLASGTGADAQFQMPEEALSLSWTTNGVVTSGTELAVDGPLSFNVLTLGDAARLVVSQSGVLALSGGLTVEAGAQAKVSVADRTLPGTYTLAHGVQSDFNLESIVVEPVAEGLCAKLERQGNRLVVRIFEDASAGMGVIGRALKLNGAGWVDTGYHYRGSGDVTSRVQFDYHTSNFGRAPGEGQTGSPSVFGFMMSGDCLSYCRYSSSNIQLWHGNAEKTWQSVSSSSLSGDLTIAIDYRAGTASWGGKSFTGLLASTWNAREDYGYWLGGVSGNNTPGYIDVKAFRAWAIDASSGTEKLVCDIVPAEKNGVPGVYDRAARQFVEPTLSASAQATSFAVDFGEVAQEFSAVLAKSEGALVLTPQFAPQTDFIFRRDGWIAAKTEVDSFVVMSYGADGTLISSETISPVSVRKSYPVVMGEANRVVVRVVRSAAAEADSVDQSYEVVEIVGSDETLERRDAKYEYSYMVPGSARFVFKRDVVSVTADLIDSEGRKAGEETLSGAVDAGGELTVEKSAQAAYRIVHVSLRRPGALLIVR